MADGLSIGPVRPTSQESRTRNPLAAQQVRTSELAVRKAERILSAVNVKGADAIRLRSLIQQAKSSNESGQSIEAERLARYALEKARQMGKLPGVTAAPDGETEEPLPAPDTEPAADDQPIETSPGLGEPDKTLYQDNSGDAGISFQMGVPLTELQAPLAVRGHEVSHLLHETQKAVLEGRPVQAGIRIHSHVDPQTGRQHVSGGRATVYIFPNFEPPEPENPMLDLEA
jgi:hypothetical protein